MLFAKLIISFISLFQIYNLDAKDFGFIILQTKKPDCSNRQFPQIFHQFPWTSVRGDLGFREEPSTPPMAISPLL